MLQPSKRPPSKNESDNLTELLQKIGFRDSVAFKQLYQTTSPKLLGIILRIIKERNRAEDILQEVYIKLWQRAEQYDPARGTPQGWLAIMARNMALDYVRAQRLRLVTSNDFKIEQIASTDEPALDYCMRQQDRKHLLDCLKGLEENKKNMVTLAYQDGLSREELADRFSTPVATVKTWLRRSLESLRSCMEAYA